MKFIKYASILLLITIMISGCGSSAKRLGKFPADDVINFYVTVSPENEIKGQLLKYLEKISSWQEADLANQLHYYGYGVKELHGKETTGQIANSYKIKVALQNFIQGKHAPFVGSRAEVTATYNLLDSKNNIILTKEFTEHSARGWASCVRKMSQEFVASAREVL